MTEHVGLWLVKLDFSFFYNYSGPRLTMASSCDTFNLRWPLIDHPKLNTAAIYDASRQQKLPETL